MEDAQVVHEEPKTEQRSDRRHFRHEMRFERDGQSFWPVIVIIFGVYFLLSNFNIINRDLLANLFRAWPALLILWGIDVYTKDKPKVRTPAIVVLVMLVVFLILTYSTPYIPYLR